MKAVFVVLCSAILSFEAGAQRQTYVGSTPAHEEVRTFLQISLTDSIDFIRWKLALDPDGFQLQCRYGLAKAGTPGFSNEQTVAFKGRLTKSDSRYLLEHKDRSIAIIEVNANVLHFLDKKNEMLVGNGGYSFALNSTDPVQADDFKLSPLPTKYNSLIVFEGRTPCHHLPALLGITKSAACNKMKWYFLFYADSVTGQPSHFLMAGIGYRKETMLKGSWQVVTQSNGRVLYRVFSEQWKHPLYLLKGSENILFFADGNGRVLVGNEDFSYTLNRRNEEYPERK